MRQVNVHEAKTHLSRLLLEVEAGQEIIIARDGKPVARLTGLATERRPRVPGRDVGRGWVAEDFNAPLPEELQDTFEA